MATSKKVTRITAADDAPKKVAKTTKVAKATTKASTKRVKAEKVESATATHKKSVLAHIGGYFKGAWVELRQVRWPNRRSTWALTLAVIIFSLFFVGLILLLDMLFKYVFELIIT